MKRAMFLFCGICWLAFGLAAGVFAWRYLADGGGMQSSGFLFFAPMLTGSVLLGLLQLTGFFALIVLCFAIGIGLLLRGLESSQSSEQKLKKQP
jgi:hypothetical protein